MENSAIEAHTQIVKSTAIVNFTRAMAFVCVYEYVKLLKKSAYQNISGA